jgi:hypothetical protein
MRRQLCIAIRARVLVSIQQQGKIMSRKFWLLFLRGAVASACLLLGFTAQAGLWSADYDPPAFVGTATFDVPGACLSGVADGLHLQSEFLGCSPIRVVANVSTNPVIDFFSVLPSSNVLSYVVIGEQFVGVNTGNIGLVTVGTTDYAFEFLATFNPGNFENIPPSVTNTVNLYDNCNFDGPLFCFGKPVLFADTVVFAAVPEPGSIGLILGALGAGWLARRRKAKA